MQRFARAFLLAALVAAPALARADEMRFSLVEFNDGKCRQACPQAISAEGEITSRTPQAFLDFIGQHIGSGRLHSIVLLNSQGGQVVASMELGRAFRTIGVAAIVGRALPGALVSGRCYSACVYALMGASKRVAPAQSRVGIHRMFMFEANRGPEDSGAATSRVYAAAPLVARLGEYAQMMGVSQEVVWSAEKISPDRIRILTGPEMKRWKLAGPKL